MADVIENDVTLWVDGKMDASDVVVLVSFVTCKGYWQRNGIFVRTSMTEASFVASSIAMMSHLCQHRGP